MALSYTFGRIFGNNPIGLYSVDARAGRERTESSCSDTRLDRLSQKVRPPVAGIVGYGNPEFSKEARFVV